MTKFLHCGGFIGPGTLDDDNRRMWMTEENENGDGMRMWMIDENKNENDDGIGMWVIDEDDILSRDKQQSDACQWIPFREQRDVSKRLIVMMTLVNGKQWDV